MVFHFGSSPQFMPRSPFDTLIHTMPFNTGVFAAELLWSPVLRKFPTVKFSLAEGVPLRIEHIRLSDDEEASNDVP